MPKEPAGTAAQTAAKPQVPAAPDTKPAGTSAPAGAGREVPAARGVAAAAAAQAAAEPAEAETDAPAPAAAMKPSVTPAAEAPGSGRSDGGGKASGAEAGGGKRPTAAGAPGRAPEKDSRQAVGPSAKGAAGGGTGEASSGHSAAASGEADDVGATPAKATHGQNGSGRRDAQGTEAQEADGGDVDRHSGNGLPDGQERSGVDGKAGAARPMADWATSGTYDNPAIWAAGADAGGQGTETAGAARRLPPRVRAVLAIVAGVLFSVVLVAVVAITNPPGTARDEARRDTQVSPATTAPATTPGKAAPGASKEWTLEPVAVDFGHQAVGTSGEVRTLFIRNGSGKSGKIVAISIEGNQSQYEVDTRCAGVALASGFRCRIAVRFAPSAIGEHHARVRISFDGRPTQASTVLFGTATR
jgi:hypothetical protein